MTAKRDKSNSTDKKSDCSSADMDLDDILIKLKDNIKEWGLVTRTARREKRLNSTLAELDAFYTSIVPYMERIIELLNKCPVKDIPKQYRPLVFIIFSMCEIDASVTKWRQVRLDNTSNPRHGIGKRSFYQRKIPADIIEVWSESTKYQDEGKGPIVLF
jgi:hypothetical protein